jgi:hypothetical protein
MTGNEIGERLDYPEADNERNDQRCRRDLKFLGADKRHNGSFKADHSADEGIN